MSKTAITIPTINIPEILKNISENLNLYGKSSDVTIFVIGDKKTPSGIREYCSKIANEFGSEIEYLGIDEQERTFQKHIDLLELFPYNTPDRVILGGMISYLRGYDRLIAVDDDNFPTYHDFVGFHSITGTETEIKLIKNDSGWFNVHYALVEENNIPFYPRGFPWKQRTPESSKRTYHSSRAKVVVNQGLVLEDPDIDAISRLFHPIRAIAMKSEFEPRFGLYPGTWSPFNYQNTSLSRELIPLYYRPLSTKRNADIWTAYLINKLAEHFGDVITFGQPLVKQVRNPHSLWEDLDVELTNNRATDHLITILRSVSLSKKTYFEALVELLDKSQKELEGMDNVPSPELDMIKKFFSEYQVWCRVISKVVNH